MNDLGRLQAALAALRQRVYAAVQPRVIGLTLDGGGSVIPTGDKGAITVPFSGRIEGWCLMADQAGSLVVDVRRCSFADAPPDSGDSIAGGSKPTLSSQQKSESYGLSGWSPDLQAGDVVGFNVDSASTVQRATLTLKVRPA